MVNVPKTIFLPLLAGRCGKSTKWSSQRHLQVNERKSDLEVKRVQTLPALGSLRSKKMLAAETRRETHFVSNEQKEKWIEDYVERETAGARKRVEDTEATVQQEQEDMNHAESVGLMNREPQKTVEQMLVAIRESLSDLASPDDGEDAEDEDDEEEE